VHGSRRAWYGWTQHPSLERRGRTANVCTRKTSPPSATSSTPSTTQVPCLPITRFKPTHRSSFFCGNRSCRALDDNIARVAGSTKKKTKRATFSALTEHPRCDSEPDRRFPTLPPRHFVDRSDSLRACAGLLSTRHVAHVRDHFWQEPSRMAGLKDTLSTRICVGPPQPAFGDHNLRWATKTALGDHSLRWATWRNPR
jgi:hypothetical protein